LTIGPVSSGYTTIGTQLLNRPAPREPRRKLGPVYGQCLVTEHRAGYQFRPLAP